MNINAGIIDQQVRGLAQRLRAELADALGTPNLDDTLARSGNSLRRSDDCPTVRPMVNGNRGQGTALPRRLPDRSTSVPRLG
jgi:hypothetical protein